MRILLFSFSALCLLAACTSHPPDSGWPSYLGDDARSHFSQLDQINTSNVANLKIAWTYHSAVVTALSKDFAANRTLLIAKSVYLCNDFAVDNILSFAKSVQINTDFANNSLCV